MAMKKRSTVVGVFEDRTHADQAVAALRKAGYRQDQIGVAMKHKEGTVDSAGEFVDETHAGSGALTGALTGLGIGALAGLGVLAGVIPVVGPAIAAGTLGVVLSNAAAGAGIAGIVGALVGAGVPEHEAAYYQDEFEAGRVLVTVHADARADEATTILRQFGAYDIDSRPDAASATTTASKATTTTAPKSTARPVAATGRTTAGAGETIEVVEEKLHADKQKVPAGEVRVRKESHTETKTIEVPVKHEEVVIERTAVHGRAATAADLREGEEIRIPVSEERVRVTKEAVVTEEVKVGKKVVEETEHVTGKVRKEEVKIEQSGDVDVRTKGSTKR